ncbi:hypothetical protein ONV78_13540 [Hahella sp. CR1]|uniref:hypothetical protein n=1 Tax=Hahella sp. CR1 TaxID=2992807 RepID=UPI002442E059|nr:hypothetical protein [Hahella sp. CR1]MDG9668760.1 hypothetical protein [Hahella sp. CR1]
MSPHFLRFSSALLHCVRPVRQRLSSKRAAVLAMTLALAGCGATRNVMYKTTGDVMVGFAQEHQTPFVLSTDDVSMNCGMSEALAPMLMSFGRVRDEPHSLAVMIYGSAGMCAESRALNEELRYMRAIRDQDAAEAEDALIAQKRFNTLAAKRNYEAYQHLVAQYGEPGGACPELDEDYDEFIWMMGMIAGLQALNNEIASGAGLGVPKNIAAKVERSAACVDDDKWWGAPMAIRATVWSMLPGAEPKGENASLRLAAAAKKGERAGVRLAHVFQALAAYGKGDVAAVKQVIRAHAKSKANKEAPPEARLLDELATTMLTGLSDRMWTEHTGHRTPVGALGKFWDDKKQTTAETVDLSDIL